MLIELKGWVWKGETYPSNISTEGHDIDRGYVNLLLGNIIYENLDMGREEEFLRRESYSYTSAKKPPHAGLRKKIDDKRKTRIKRSTGRM